MSPMPKTEEPVAPEAEVAEILIRLGAVTLSPREPYTWSSGVRSPIYCDNRRLLGHPRERSRIEDLWSQLILSRSPSAEVLAAVATAGIPHAAYLSERLGLPMVYVRSGAKGHGLGKTVEGGLRPGARAVIIEDLFSSGGSTLNTRAELLKAGARVESACAIVSYGLAAQRESFEAVSLPWFTLTNLGAIKEAALRLGSLTQEELRLIDQGMASVEAQLSQRGAPVA